jgi:hypothetical protein
MLSSLRLGFLLYLQLFVAVSEDSRLSHTSVPTDLDILSDCKNAEMSRNIVQIGQSCAKRLQRTTSHVIAWRDNGTVYKGQQCTL